MFLELTAYQAFAYLFWIWDVFGCLPLLSQSLADRFIFQSSATEDLTFPKQVFRDFVCFLTTLSSRPQYFFLLWLILFFTKIKLVQMYLRDLRYLQCYTELTGFSVCPIFNLVTLISWHVAICALGFKPPIQSNP